MSDITEIPSQVGSNLETSQTIVDNASQLLDYEEKGDTFIY